MHSTRLAPANILENAKVLRGRNVPCPGQGQIMTEMWWSLFVFLACCAPVLAFSASSVSAYDIEHALSEAPYGVVDEDFEGWIQTEETLQPPFSSVWSRDKGSDQEFAPGRLEGNQRRMVPSQVKELQSSGSSRGQSEGEHMMTTRSRARAPQPSASPHIFCTSETDDSDYVGAVSIGASYNTFSEGKLSSEYYHDTEDDGASGVVEFKWPRSPKDFVKHWPEQKRLFESLSHPFSPEQRRNLQCAYYPFAPAGQLLEELGEERFLKRFGKDTVTQMQQTTMAGNKQRKAAVREKWRKPVGIDGAEDSGASGVVIFTWPKSPEDFVECWPEQKRLYESLPRPFSPEQRRLLVGNYYQFAVAGQLLEELGRKVFMERFGKGTVKQMQQTAIAENKQRKAAGEEQRKRRVDIDETEGVEASSFAVFVNPKTPKEFVKHWPGQKRLYERLPRPLTPEQRHRLKNTYCRFTAAGQLLEELGEEVFLQRFGKGGVTDMRIGAADEIKQRRAFDKNRKAAAFRKRVEKGELASIVTFVKPKTPWEFVERWPEQKRLFESIQRPFSPEQRCEIKRSYQPFAAAGQLLEELGDNVFMERLGRGFVEPMRKAAIAEVKRRRAAEKDQRSVAKRSAKTKDRSRTT